MFAHPRSREKIRSAHVIASRSTRINWRFTVNVGIWSHRDPARAAQPCDAHARLKPSFHEWEMR
jgi:hypothetical protein